MHIVKMTREHIRPYDKKVSAENFDPVRILTSGSSGHPVIGLQDLTKSILRWIQSDARVWHVKFYLKIDTSSTKTRMKLSFVGDSLN